MKSTYDFDDTANFTQTSSSKIFKEFKRSMMNVYTNAFLKELNAFLSFFNHLKNLKMNQITWKKMISRIAIFVLKTKKKINQDNCFFFITEQLKTSDFKKINEFEKYNIKIKIFVDDANVFKNILFLNFHEFDRWNTNNDFHSNIVNTNFFWLNAEFKKIKKNFDVEKNRNEIIFIIIKLFYDN
jgi:hypothetical protein